MRDLGGLTEPERRPAVIIKQANTRDLHSNNCCMCIAKPNLNVFEEDVCSEGAVCF